MGKSKKNKAIIIPDVVLISDPNNDVDDLLSFVTAAALADQGKLKLHGVVCTSGALLTRIRRAKFAKGALIALGHPFLKVAVGGEYLRREKGYDDAFAVHTACEKLERNGQNIDRNGAQLLQTALKKAENKSLTVVINAQMSDVAVFLHNCSAAALKKIGKLVIMGGCRESLDETGFVVPDENSANIAMCLPAAEDLFAFAQENNIRIYLTPKETVYHVPLGKDFIECLEKTQHPVAEAAVATLKIYFENFWQSLKNGDFSHFDIRRFAKIFMGADYRIASRLIKGRDRFEDVWPKIKHFYLYDALAVIAASNDVFSTYGKFVRVTEKYPVYKAEIFDSEGMKKYLEELILQKLGNMQKAVPVKIILG